MLFAASFAAFNCAKATSCRAFAGGGRLLGAALLLPQVFKLFAQRIKFFFCRLTCARYGEHGVVHCAANPGQGVPSASPVASAAALFWFHLASAAESSLSCPTTGQTRGARRVFGSSPQFFALRFGFDGVTARFQRGKLFA